MDRLSHKIEAYGRVIRVLCAACQILLCTMATAGVALTLASAAGVALPQHLLADVTSNGLFDALCHALSLDETVDAHTLARIRTLTFSLTALFGFHVAGQVRRLVASLSGGEPFTLETARRLRVSLWEVALIAVWNVPVALVCVFFTLLVSYLVEYGAYLKERADQTGRIQEEMIVSFAEICENKSGQTGSHIRRVAEYSRVLARALGLSADAAEALRLASTMHDIGKLLVPAEILEAPRRLTDEEYATIRQHTTWGGQLLEHVEGDVMALARTIALDHHERWDGRGYASGKQGDEISLEGRIVAVADVYDALTSRRSYKDAWSEERARDEIVAGAGTQFDPAVVSAFEEHYDEISAICHRWHDEPAPA